MIGARQEALPAATLFKQRELKAAENAQKLGKDELPKLSNAIVADDKILSTSAAEKVLSAPEAIYEIDRKEFTNIVLAGP